MTDMLTAAAILLGAALLFVGLFRRLGLGATLGYIVGGAVVGASGLVGSPEAIMSVSEIGIAMLLFLVGLELRPSRLWRLRRDIFGLGLLQVVIAGGVIAALLHVGLGLDWAAAAALGLPLGLSSTAQVLPMLKSSGDLNSPYGERAFSILLMQDLALIPLITIVAALSPTPDPAQPGGWVLAGSTLGAVVGLVLAGRFLLNPLFRLIGRLGERELFVVAGLFAVIASAALMHWLQLSVALGAFVAGVMLAESPYRHELESDVDPFRSILLGLFFMSVGMLLDLSVIAQRPLTVLGLAAGVIAVKVAILYPLARGFRMPSGRAISLALLLSQAGEFGFVLFAQAQRAGVVGGEAASLFGAVVTTSMAATPFLMKLIERLQARMPEQDIDLEGPEFSPETNAIVVGYGRFGQTVAQMLQAKRIPVTMIDRAPTLIELAGEFGTKVYYGDGTRLDLLRTAGAETAEAILFCHDDPGFGAEQLAPVLQAFPKAKVMVRVFDRRQMLALDGCDVPLEREVFESAVAMGRGALSQLGIAQREVARVEHEYRLRDRERLQAQAHSGDLHAGIERSFSAERGLDGEGED
jgi:glutathione-regulated potassium-efflux system protein KefB